MGGPPRLEVGEGDECRQTYRQMIGMVRHIREDAVGMALIAIRFT